MRDPIKKASMVQGEMISIELRRAMEKLPDGTARYLADEDTDDLVAQRLGHGITSNMVAVRRRGLLGSFPRDASEESVRRREKRAKREAEKASACFINYADIAARVDRVMEHLLGMKEHFDTQFLKLVDGQAAHVAEVRGLLAEINTRIAGVERAATMSSKPFTDAVTSTRIPDGQSTMGQPALFGEKNGR